MRERMNHGTLQQPRQLLSLRISIVDLPPAIIRGQLASQHDLVILPVLA
jgi:hypothetical protein